MAITPLTVTIDLNPSYKKIPAVYVSQLDNNLRELAITVQDGGVNYDVASSGYDVYVEGTKPDKHGFSYKVTDIGGTVVGSVVTVPMQTQMTCVQGMVPTEIVLKSGADRIGSANFLLVVERAGLAEDVDVSETDIPAYIDGAQQAAAAAAQSADDAEDAKDLAVAAKDTAVSVAASIPEDYTTLSNDVSDLKNATSALNAGYKVNSITIEQADLLQGLWDDNNAFNPNSETRVGSKSAFAVSAGDKIAYSSNGMVNARISFKVFADRPATQKTQTPLETTEWIPISSGSYQIQNDGYVVFNLSYGNDANISPSDISANIVVLTFIETEYTEYTNKYLKEFFNINYFDHWIYGAYANADGRQMYRTDYICTPNEIPVNAGDTVSFAVNIDHTFQSIYIQWFNENKTYIGNSTGAQGKNKATVIAPENAKYFTVSASKRYAEAMDISEYADTYIFINPVSPTVKDFTDAYFEAYTDSTLNEVMWSLFVLNYSHNGAGGYGPLNTRNAIIKPIRFPYAIKVETDSVHAFAYQFYSSKNNNSETLTQASGWIRSVTIPANQWFCMIVRNSDDSVTDQSTTKALQFSYDDLVFFVNEIEDGRIDADGKTYNTIGAHIRSIEDSMNPSVSTDYAITADFAKRNLKATALGTLTYMQSFCKYGDYYYSIDGTNISKQDSTFAEVSNVALGTGHGNALQLGHNGKAYASGWNDQKVYEVDLATLTITNTYTLPTTGYTTVAVDDVNELMYIFQRDSYPDTEDYYNFIVYDYANEQIISTKKTTVKFCAMQACDFYNGKIIVLNGMGGNYPNGYRIYNTNGDVIAEYVLGSFASQEPEGICIDRDTQDILISFGAKVVYKIA